MIGGLSVHLTESFLRDYRRLGPDIQAAVTQCLEDLAASPIPRGRRVHPVSPVGQKPTIFTADVTTNKAYKLSFEIRGRVAYLLRVGTHRQIDRAH